MDFLAGIVLYNPELGRLKENLEAIIPQVKRVVLVDNASENIDEIVSLLNLYPNCDLMQNKKNEGIAYALNQILEYAEEKGFKWFLTLDQDSVCSSDLLKVYEKYLDFEKIAIITSRVVDRNFTVRNPFDEKEEYRYVTYCITSGCLVNTVICRACGGWDSQMFIDNVDGDICINYKTHGYHVLSINYGGILHEVGHGKNVRFLWMKDQIYNHPAFRHYYIARNRIYVARKYPEEFVIWREVCKEVRNLRLILCFEDDKIAKCKARIRGIRDGFKMEIKRSVSEKNING